MSSYSHYLIHQTYEQGKLTQLSSVPSNPKWPLLNVIHLLGSKPNKWKNYNCNMYKNYIKVQESDQIQQVQHNA